MRRCPWLGRVLQPCAASARLHAAQAAPLGFGILTGMERVLALQSHPYADTILPQTGAAAGAGLLPSSHRSSGTECQTALPMPTWLQSLAADWKENYDLDRWVALQAMLQSSWDPYTMRPEKRPAKQARPPLSHHALLCQPRCARRTRSCVLRLRPPLPPPHLAIAACRAGCCCPWRPPSWAPTQPCLPGTAASPRRRTFRICCSFRRCARRPRCATWRRTCTAATRRCCAAGCCFWDTSAPSSPPCGPWTPQSPARHGWAAQPFVAPKQIRPDQACRTWLAVGRPGRAHAGSRHAVHARVAAAAPRPDCAHVTCGTRVQVPLVGPLLDAFFLWMATKHCFLLFAVASLRPPLYFAVGLQASRGCAGLCRGPQRRSQPLSLS